MSLEHKRNKYFSKVSNITKWSTHKIPKQKFYNQIISIPCYAELDYIFLTLDSINSQCIEILSTTLVSITINNPNNCDSIIFDNNLLTFKKIIKMKYMFEIVIIDCFSKNRAFTDKYAGVGLARKLSVDLILKYTHLDTIICFLDADTIIKKDYLYNIYKNKALNKWKCAVVNFKHQNDEIRTHDIIQKYDLLLKNNALQLSIAGSPYCYVPLGSTMICTSYSYVSIGGMNKRKAAEDFYFLQEMQKCFNVYKIKDIYVYPSSRFINRTYIGTSKRLYDVINNKNSISDYFFNKESYMILSFFLNLILIDKRNNYESILKKIKNRDIILYNYINNTNFILIWPNISKLNDINFNKEFHRWFDHLKTIKLLKLYK